MKKVKKNSKNLRPTLNLSQKSEKSEKKIKVLTLGDHPLLKTGVATQSLNVFKALLDSGRFCIRSLGGGFSSEAKIAELPSGPVEGYGEDFLILPVQQYGTPDQLKTIINNEKPDMIWLMTDPRYWMWLWKMEDDIRPNIPIVYYHVWDNYPYPSYNEFLYDSNDGIVSISKLTEDIVENVSTKVKFKKYIPHAVDPEVFKPMNEEDVSKFRNEFFSLVKDYQKVFFYNSRNARRKQTGSLLFWFRDFLDRNPDAAHLVMHTDIVDHNGTDLGAIVQYLKLDKHVTFSPNKIATKDLVKIYNMADFTINVSDAEGFGLSTLESLSCGTPIIATVTGGLQDQLKNEEGKWFGIPLTPSAKSVVGHPDTPWVYEDRVDGQTVVAALEKALAMSRQDIKDFGLKGRNEHVLKNFNFEDFKRNWVYIMLDVHNECGSWPNKNYMNYEIWEIK